MTAAITPLRPRGQLALALTLAAGLLQPALPAAAADEPGPATDTAFTAAVRADTEWIAAVDDRSVGSAGHAQVTDRLLDRLRAVPGVRVWTQSFDVLMPVTRTAVLTAADGPNAGDHRIYPVWPSLVRLNVTPPGGLSGRAVYIHSGAYEDIPPLTLRGEIAVMEARSGANWKRAFAFGARAVVLLGGAETQGDMHAQLTDQPLNQPRFYLPDGDLAADLRTGLVARVTLRCEAAWQMCTATNVYAFVPAQPGAAPRPALALAAPLDAVSALQGLAPGADAAVDAAFVLNTIERCAHDPAAVPVVAAFLDAQGINQLGERQMFRALWSLPEDRNRIVEEDRQRAGEYARHQALARELGAGSDALERLHASRFRPLHRYVKDVLAGELNDLDETVPDLRLEYHNAAEPDRPAIKARLDAAAARQAQLKGLQNQLLFKTPLAEANRPEAAALWARVLARIDRQCRDVDRPAEAYREGDALRESMSQALGLTGADALPLAFVLGVDLSDAGTSCGPALYCPYLDVDENARRSATPFVRWLGRFRGDNTSQVWPDSLRPFVNLSPLDPEGSVSMYMIGRVPTLTSAAPSFGAFAATWATLQGYRVRVDTALDRPEGLDWERLAPQVEATRRLVEALLRDPRFPGGRHQSTRLWARVTGAIVDRSPGDPVPRVPQPDMLVALVRRARQAGGGCSAGVRCSEFAVTGVDGYFRFDAMPAAIGTGSWLGNQIKSLALEAFALDGHGRIERAVNRVVRMSGLKQDLSIDPNPAELRAMVFDCVETVSAPVFLDVRQLRALQKVQVFDALTRRAPEYANVSLADGQVCALLPPQTRWQMLVRPGETDVRMLLINATDPEEETSADLRDNTLGFAQEEPLPDLAELVSARDFWRINERRLRGFRSAGIVSPPLERVHASTHRYLDEAKAAAARDDGAGLYAAATAALANEMRAYKGIRATADDVVRAAMILLLGLLPFSIAMERLLLASPHIYRQIFGTVGIFAVMCAALWSFHPAFRITSQPLMLVLAFVIIFLTATVVSILMRRFESDLERIRGGRAEESGAGTARSGLVACALTIGIATMRKRKLRTALTGTTVALITFALLSFSSTTRVKPFLVSELARQAAYTGVLVQQPNRAPLAGQAVDYVRGVAGTHTLVVPRYWWVQSRDDQRWRARISTADRRRELLLKGGMVLRPEEGAMLGLDRRLPDWNAFTNAPSCYLSPSRADELRVAAGDTLLVGGGAYAFLGTFEPNLFSQELRTLTGDPLSPLDYASIDSEERRALEALEVGDAEGEAAEQQSSLHSLLEYMDPNDMVLLSAATGIPGQSLHNIAVRTDTPAEAEALAMKLAERLDYPVYFSTGRGVKVVTAAPLLPRAPRSIFIPLLVAGLIIFNTMLNSIAERKKEIHVYTSLGLAPLHVAGIFISEALTYGLMGTIFGYVAGQGLASLFSHLGWLGDITLNYSGSQVMYTMALVLGVVLLSAIVPAAMAARVASPSKETSWRLPPPHEGVIRDVLPFTVTVAASGGVLAFLYEYMDAHSEGSLGRFACDDLRLLNAEQAGDGARAGLEAAVWLDPYDLGVRQTVRILVRPAVDEICELHIELIHRAGQMKNWHKLNRVFVADLRNQMLGWRNLSGGRVMDYIRLAAQAGG